MDGVRRRRKEIAVPKRILLTTTGSLGDLHPFIAIGLELAARGHAVTLASSNFYREKVEKTGLSFAPMGPHIGPETAKDLDRILDRRNGPEYLIRRILYPSVPEAYAETMAAAVQGCDLIVTHPITFGSQIAAERLRLPWVSTVTAPLSFFSRYDPPLIDAVPAAIRLRAFGPGVYGLFQKLAQAMTKTWYAPITGCRETVGLGPGGDPIFEGQHSPRVCAGAVFSADGRAAAGLCRRDSGDGVCLLRPGRPRTAGSIRSWSGFSMRASRRSCLRWARRR